MLISFVECCSFRKAGLCDLVALATLFLLTTPSRSLH